MRTNILLQRIALAFFVGIVAVIAFLVYLERTGQIVNVNQDWNYLGNTYLLGYAPDALLPGQKPELDRRLLDDANTVGRAHGTTYVGIDSYRVYLDVRLSPEQTTPGDVLLYVVRDTRGARSSFAVNVVRGNRTALYVNHLALRQSRTAAEFALAPACVHDTAGAVGNCLLVRGNEPSVWQCRCTTAGGMAP